MVQARQRGFTAIELLVVMAIIGIIAAIAIAAFNGAMRKSRRNALIADARTLQEAFLQYHLDRDQYPPCCDPPEEALQLNTLWPLTRYEYIRNPDSILTKLDDKQLTAYDSPDHPTTNHDFYAVLTHRKDTSIVVLVADTDEYPPFRNQELYGLYLIEDGQLIPITDMR